MHDQFDNSEPNSKLRKDLLRLHAPENRVPSEFDDKLFQDVRTLQRFRGWKRVQAWSVPFAAAAALGLMVWLQPAADPDLHNPHGQRMAEVRFDVDGSGNVDIKDAFTLARYLRDGAATSVAWDYNSDGRIDAQDVDLVGSAAVRISGVKQ